MAAALKTALPPGVCAGAGAAWGATGGADGRSNRDGLERQRPIEFG